MGKSRGAPRAGCAIIYRDLILLVHQKESNFWGFPKGRLNREEKETRDFETCAARELNEETGMSISKNELCQKVIGSKTHIYIVKVDRFPETVIDNREIDGYVWVPWRDCILMRMSNAGKDLAKKMIKKLRVKNNPCILI